MPSPGIIADGKRRADVDVVVVEIGEVKADHAVTAA
jgi:hypothetical protein